MKLLLLSLPLTLCIASAIPNAHPHGGTKNEFAIEDSVLDGRAQKAQAPMSYEEAKAEVAKEFNGHNGAGTLKVKWNSNTSCSKNKCKGKQVQDTKDSDKCRDCKAGTKPNPDHTKCMRTDTGCAEDEIQTTDKKCQKCDKNKIPDTAGKTCTDSKPTKEKGKCPNDQILDPAEGGQDANTNNPKCIGDDDKKCPAGKSAATRRADLPVDEANYEPTCGPDDDPDHKCDDPNTFDFREIPIVGDGKIQHSCRSTRKAQDDKEKKYQKTSKTGSTNKDTKNREQRDKQRRTRAGWCWVALASMEAWPADEINALSQDEVDGLTGSWPNETFPTPPGDGSIPDYVVSFTGIVHAVIDAGGGDSAGWGGFISAIAKIFGKDGKAATGASDAGSVVKDLKTGSRAPASAKALDAAKKSATIQKVLKDSSFQDCLSTVAGTVATDATDAVSQKNVKFGGTWGTYDTDWSRKPDPKIKLPPAGTEDQQITIHYGADTDSETNTLKTYHDAYIRTDRLLYEGCTKLANNDNAITDISTQGGCCSFYNGENCEKDTQMFTMYNRQDGDLRGAHNDAISSFWCTFDEGCKGAP